jgi:hypothetical protein
MRPLTSLHEGRAACSLSLAHLASFNRLPESQQYCSDHLLGTTKKAYPRKILGA